METEPTNEETQKKGRVRRKQTQNSILKQMHFYFSDSNLSKDRFLAEKLKESEFVDLSVFLTFNKIAKLTSSIDEIVKAIKKSTFLQLDENCYKVKRTTPLKVKTNEDECIIYVQTLQPDVTHDWLINVFSEFGKVEYVSIPKYSHNKFAKGFAFIEYENEEQVKAALAYFESIGGRISSQIDAEKLCSNKYEEGSDYFGVAEEDKHIKEGIGAQTVQNEIEDANEKKRKHSNDEAEGGGGNGNKSKKLRTEDSQETEETKLKKKSTKRKALIKELGLQVLPKLEWKKLRNRYWDMQRKKMKQLKQHLNKRRLHRNNYEDIKKDFKSSMQVANTGQGEEEGNDYVKGVIVKLKLKESCSESKKIKNELKNINNAIQYVDVPITLTSDEVYIRFATPESAQDFCATSPSKAKGEGIILVDDEEKQYWDKIKLNRDARLSKDVKKQRGRDKLLKKAERELGKHIRFDDADD